MGINDWAYSAILNSILIVGALMALALMCLLGLWALIYFMGTV